MTNKPVELSAAKYAALFAAESREQLGRATRAAAAGDVDACFRAVHTVKGMAGAMGCAAAEAAAHAAEHLLARLREHDTSVERSPAWPALAEALDLLEAAVERAGRPASARAARGAAPEPRAVRVDAAHLDRLLDVAGEFAAVRERLAGAAARSVDPAVTRAAHDVARLTQHLQGVLMEARLVPLAELFDRLPRVVREAARAVGREVAFAAEGGDAAVDRGVLDALAEPLTHLLRNAVDHGVEPAAERAVAGKPAVGQVRVTAARAGNGVCVTVEDDGRGVDRLAVRAAAVARGVLPPGAAAEPLDDAALLAVLAHPGFSTAGQVTRVSGRGVGVDAALARVRALGGSLALDTEPGRGSRFVLRVPLTLAVTPALLVRAGGTAYALPAAHVRGTGEPADAPGAAALAALLGVVQDEPASATGDVVYLERPGERPLAVGVDLVLGQRDCVVKPLPAVRAAFRTAAGATILDGGDVALVLDVPALVARATPSRAPARAALPTPAARP